MSPKSKKDLWVYWRFKDNPFDPTAFHQGLLILQGVAKMV
jgi:hypothetical protein